MSDRPPPSTQSFAPSSRRRLDRGAVLRSAGDMLEADGAAALTVRGVATRAHISVQGVYTLFGGKPGLCEALFIEGFATLQTALDAADAAAKPAEAVVGQVLAYRTTALAGPGRYALMFSRPVAEFEPSPAARSAAMNTFVSLVEALRRELPATGSPPAEQAALIVWALNHGLVSLELDGVLPGDNGETLERAVRDLLRSWTNPTGVADDADDSS